jgi:hypothetical protein
MKVAELKAYEIFKNKFGEREAETVFEYFEAAKTDSISPKQVDDRLIDFKSIFATKADLADVKADIIKWMFIFWIGQLGATIAIILLFIKK